MLLLAIKPNILFPLLHPTTWSEQARYMPSRQHSRLEPILSLPPSQSKARLADVSLTLIGDLQQCFPPSNGYGWLSGHFSIAIDKTSFWSCKEDLLFQKKLTFSSHPAKVGSHRRAWRDHPRAGGGEGKTMPLCNHCKEKQGCFKFHF